MIISAVTLTFTLMLWLLPTWILVMRNKPAKAAGLLLPNLVAPPLWIGFLVYACLASCTIGH